MAADLPRAFKELGKERYNLLDPKGLDDIIASLRPRWMDYEVNGKMFRATEKTKAVVYCDNSPVTLSMVGVVDGDNSQLGEYGNLWIPSTGRSFTPDINDLNKARFVLNMTYPRGDDVGRVDKTFVDKTGNQLMGLNKIQSALNAILSKDSSLPAVSDDKITDCVDFEESGGGVYGSIKITLGNVYSPASRKVRAKDVTELSPKKSTDTNSKPKCDSLGFFDHGRIAKSNTLQRVESLPVFLADGSPAKARDSDDLSTLLYSGRWIRADVQMIIWNIKNAKGNSRSFKLEAVRVSLLPTMAQQLNPNVKFLKPNSLTDFDGEVPQDLVDGAAKDKATGDDDDTLSEGTKPDGRSGKIDSGEDDDIEEMSGSGKRKAEEAQLEDREDKKRVAE